MLSGSVERTYGSDLCCCHLHPVVLAAEREQAVALVCHVQVDVQFGLLLLDRHHRHAEFDTLVGHRTYVGHQFVVGEGRYRYVIGVEHIGSQRVVILGRQHQAVVPCPEVDADVRGGACLPFQVGIGILHRAHCHGGYTVDRYDAVLLHRIECGV